MHLETPPQELQELIDRIQQMPMGDEELATVRRALALAEQNDLPGWAYQLRLWFNQSTFRMGDTNALLTSFTKSLSIHDSDPQRFPLEIDDEVHLLFQYKWVAEMLNDSPAYSLAQINGIYSDMERRFRESGASPSGYLQTRFSGACERGEWDDAAQIFAQLQAAPRDSLSHCEACYRSTSAMYFADQGDSDRALELLEEIFSGEYVCGDEPEYSESQAMLLHLKKGNLDEAKRLHYKSLAALAQNPEPSGMVLRHMLFCVLTGNTERALELVEKNGKIFNISELNVARQFDALTALGVLADALIKADRGHIPVRGTGSSYYEKVLSTIAPAASGNDFTAQELNDFVWQRAQDIQRQFDERNANDHYTKRYEARRALLETRYDLPIGIEEFEPVEIYQGDTATASLETGDDYVAAVADALPADVAGAARLLTEAQEKGLGADLTDALFYFLAVDLDAPKASGFSYEQLADLYAQHGLGNLASAVLKVRGRLAGELTPEDLSDLEGVAQQSRETEPKTAGYLGLVLASTLVYTASELANLHLSTALETLETLPMMQRAALITADLSLADNEILQARQALAQAAALSFGSRAQDIEIALLEARIAVWSDKFEEADEAFKKAINLALAVNDYARAYPVLMTMARSDAANDDPVQSARTLTRAARYAHMADAPGQALNTINHMLGTQLVNAGQAHDALGPLTQAVNWYMENDGDPEAATSALMALGESAARAGEFQQAFSAWYFGANYSKNNDQVQAEFAFLLRITDFLLEQEHPESLEFASDTYTVAKVQGEPAQIVTAAKRLATANAVIAGNADFTELDKAIEALAATAEKGTPDVEITKIEVELHRARLLWRLNRGQDAGEAALVAARIASDIDLGEAQFDALVLAGVAFKSAGLTDRAREVLTESQNFSEPGESPYEFAQQQLDEL